MATTSLQGSPADPVAPRPAIRARLHALAPFIPVIFVLGAAGDDLVSRTRVGVDFEVYYRAAVRFVAGEPLYQLADGKMCWKYSPAAAALLTPFTMLPARVGNVFYNLGSAAALVFYFRFGASLPRADRGLAGNLAATFYAMPLYVLLFFFGQSDALLLALAVLSERDAERRPWRSGLLWAVALLFKPPMLILGVLAIAGRQWRRIAWAAGFSSALLSVGLARYGLTAGIAELGAWRHLLATTTPPLICPGDNQSVFGVVCGWIATPERPLAFRAGVALLGGSAVLALAIPLVRIARRDADAARALALAAALHMAAFLSPLGWRVNLLAAVPFAYVLAGLARTARRVALRAAAAGVLGVMLVIGNLTEAALGRTVIGALLDGRFWGLGVLGMALVATWGVAVDGTGSRAAGSPGSDAR